MDKKFQEFRTVLADKKNRTTVMAVSAGIAFAAGITTFITKRGKAKR